MFSYNFLSVFILVQYFAHLTYSQPNVKFFRKDYVYLEATRAFYKIQTIHKTWDDARAKCEMEGARLFYPDDEDEVTAVVEHWNKTQPFRWIFIGVSTPNVKEVFETVDGLPIAEVYDRWGPGEPNDAGGVEGCVVMRQDGTLNDDSCAKKFPYICKKPLDTLQWNTYCNIPDPGSSYKMDLFQTGGVEGCVVILWREGTLNDDSCAKKFPYICKKPLDTLQWNTYCNLPDLGSSYKMDLFQTGGVEGCVVILWRDGTLNDDSCAKKFPYICKKPLDTLQWNTYCNIPDPGSSYKMDLFQTASVEGCVVICRDGTLNDDSCAKKFPYFFKKPFDSLQWNTYCNIPNPAYEYNPKRGRCYKFHLSPTSWSEAFKVCDSEQSYLAIINDEEEAAHLANLTNKAPKDNVEGNYLRGAVHLGFKKNYGIWKTIKGSTLKESGYSKWGGGQPDGGEDETCGSMFYNGHLNDISCATNLFFICEHEIDILSSDYILRFGEVFKPIKP